MSDQHESPIKTPKQLILVVVLAFVVPIITIVLLTQLVTSGEKGVKEPDTDVLLRIQPVGKVVLAGASGPKVALSGEQVFNQVCKTCHETGVAGAPKVGDKAAWGKVIAQGQTTLVDHATHGIRGMPPKGGNPDLDTTEVARAVVYMANQAGANWKEPAAEAPSAAGTQKGPDTAGLGPTPPGGTAPPVPPTTPAPAPAAAPAPATSVAAAAAPAAAPAAAGKVDGKKVFETTCAVCHGAGIAGAPKFGDKAAWAPRLKTGMDALYNSALKGKAAMPAKGGNLALSDAEVKAAVDYMAAAAK